MEVSPVEPENVLRVMPEREVLEDFVRSMIGHGPRIVVFDLERGEFVRCSESNEQHG